MRHDRQRFEKQHTENVGEMTTGISDADVYVVGLATASILSALELETKQKKMATKIHER